MSGKLDENVTRKVRGRHVLTEGVADFDLLVAGPGGVVRPGGPAGGVADGVLRRGRRRDHQEQDGQGQTRATG